MPELIAAVVTFGRRSKAEKTSNFGIRAARQMATGMPRVGGGLRDHSALI